MNKKRRGRPPKGDGEAYTNYVYARLLRIEDARLNDIAESQSLPANGGRSAAVRFAINKIHALLFPAGRKENRQ